MKKLDVIICVIGGVLPMALFAFRPRPHTAVNGSLAADSPAIIAVGATSDLSRAAADIRGHASESIRRTFLTGAHIKESDTQKLIDVIAVALRSGDLADWERISQNELPELIKSDPQAAAGLALSLDPGFIREQMLRQVAHGWAAQDSAVALAWASGLTDAEDRKLSLADVCIQMLQADPAEAVASATQYGLANQGGLFGKMTEQWAAKDPVAALSWADQLPEGAERDEVMSSVAFVEARSSPEGALNLVIHEIPPGSQQEEAAISVLHQWALQDFVSASAWADQFGDGPLRDRAKQELHGIDQYRQALNN